MLKSWFLRLARERAAIEYATCVMRRSGAVFCFMLAAMFGHVLAAPYDDLDKSAAVVRNLSPDGAEMAYWMIRPRSEAASAEKWPVLVFLHGSGERGDDLRLVLNHGPFGAAAADPSFPFFVIAPQLPEGAHWRPETVIAIIEDAIAKAPVDRRRIYLTGLSLGGHGTWDTAAAYPDYFAAIAPISGYGDPAEACRFKELPVWSFHGVEDDIVLAADNQSMVDAVRDCGGAPGMTLYPDTGHDAWTRTYDDPQLYRWLLSHQRSAP